MADEAEVILEVRPDGTVRFEVKGVSGKACEDIERLVLEALGTNVTHRERTPEYYARAETGAKARLRSLLKRG